MATERPGRTKTPTLCRDRLVDVNRSGLLRGRRHRSQDASAASAGRLHRFALIGTAGRRLRLLPGLALAQVLAQGRCQTGRLLRSLASLGRRCAGLYGFDHGAIKAQTRPTGQGRLPGTRALWHRAGFREGAAVAQGQSTSLVRTGSVVQFHSAAPVTTEAGTAGASAEKEPWRNFQEGTVTTDGPWLEESKTRLERAAGRAAGSAARKAQTINSRKGRDRDFEWQCEIFTFPYANCLGGLENAWFALL